MQYTPGHMRVRNAPVVLEARINNYNPSKYEVAQGKITKKRRQTLQTSSRSISATMTARSSCSHQDDYAQTVWSSKSVWPQFTYKCDVENTTVLVIVYVASTWVSKVLMGADVPPLAGMHYLSYFMFRSLLSLFHVSKQQTCQRVPTWFCLS